jgi:hypothetical protein
LRNCSPLLGHATTENGGFQHEIIGQPSPALDFFRLAAHYLDTEASGSEQTVGLQCVAGRVNIFSDFSSDLVPKKGGRNKSIVCIARGLYRYGPIGTIYWCRKIKGKNVCRRLQTTDKTRAMAISVLHIYEAGQNGNFEISVVAEMERYAPETAIIVSFMRDFGVGQAEVKYLLGEHIDLTAQVIHFRRKKTGKPFDVPIFGHAKPFIEQLKCEGRLQTGRPVVAWRNPREALAAASERLGLPAYEPRALRRCFIVHCLQQGIDPSLVAKWQGHKDAKLIFSVYGKYIDREYEWAQAEKLGGVTTEAPAGGNATGVDQTVG